MLSLDGGRFPKDLRSRASVVSNTEAPIMRTQLDVATAPTMPTRGIELMENSTGLMPREIYISAGNQQHEMRGSPVGEDIFR